MNKTLLSELSKMDDCEFFTLEHYIAIARMVRDTMSKNAISEKDMAVILGVKPAKIKSIVNGAYPFDLRLLAKLQAYNEQVAAKNARIKVEMESVGFADYKHQSPLILNRINELLDTLEINKKEQNVRK